MPFIVLKDGATIPADNGTRISVKTGEEVGVIKSSVYLEGELLTDEQVSQYVKDQYSKGNEKVVGLIEKISQKEYDKKLSEQDIVISDSSKIDQPVTRVDSDKEVLANATE